MDFGVLKVYKSMKSVMSLGITNWGWGCNCDYSVFVNRTGREEEGLNILKKTVAKNMTFLATKVSLIENKNLQNVVKNAKFSQISRQEI
jgi:hypothetical protein